LGKLLFSGKIKLSKTSFHLEKFKRTVFCFESGRNCLPGPGKPTEDIWFGKRRYLVWKKE
jgi:hypothetical protein